jgi:hypothetical protein
MIKTLPYFAVSASRRLRTYIRRAMSLEVFLGCMRYTIIEFIFKPSQSKMCANHLLL